uniref:Uncharacterized protein n=2 Tax=Clastoptera arizonana TaxID=38151 RepID=A0A1B6C9P2_9HEMI
MQNTNDHVVNNTKNMSHKTENHQENEESNLTFMQHTQSELSNEASTETIKLSTNGSSLNVRISKVNQPSEAIENITLISNKNILNTNNFNENKSLEVTESFTESLSSNHSDTTNMTNSNIKQNAAVDESFTDEPILINASPIYINNLRVNHSDSELIELDFLDKEQDNNTTHEPLVTITEESTKNQAENELKNNNETIVPINETNGPVNVMNMNTSHGKTTLLETNLSNNASNDHANDTIEISKRFTNGEGNNNETVTETEEPSNVTTATTTLINENNIIHKELTTSTTEKGSFFGGFKNIADYIGFAV